jgi:GNAT superfamily N-acetyltransferase
VEFQKLQLRLRELGVDVPDDTVRRWATTKLITGPTRYSKSGQRGQFRDWPEESVEEAAAVWALKNLDTYLGASPNHDTIRRVRHLASEIHHRLTKETVLGSSLESILHIKKDVTPKGEKRDFICSYDLHPLIELWIASIEKVRHKIPISEPRRVIFLWLHFLGDGKCTFRDVALEESAKLELSLVERSVSLDPSDAAWRDIQKISGLSPDQCASILDVINDAASAYKGVIPQDRWKEPYMSEKELADEIAAGVRFYGWVEDDLLLGIAGIQHANDVDLFRHCYVRTDYQRHGIGGALLGLLLGLAQSSRVLVGTWEDAVWAVRFYERYGFKLVSREEKDELLKKYWNIPDRQIETSIVLSLTQD